MLPLNAPVDALKTFEEGLPVRLISTPREQMRTCSVNEELASVIERNVEQFDYLPVTENPGHIVGLIELGSFGAQAMPAGSVRNHMQPLSEENLIGADAGILSFLRDADRRRLRLIVSGRDISGLVSLFDLQKLPARAALFALVTHLEIVMTDAIRREFLNTEGWLGRLAPDRRLQVANEIQKSRDQDSFVDALLFTHLADKATIIRKSPNSPFERSIAKSQFFKIQELRNSVAHAKDYALTRETASAVCQAARMIDEWSNTLSDWPPL